MTHDEFELLTMGAEAAYERILGIVSLKGRNRGFVEAQLRHLREGKLVFDHEGNMHLLHKFGDLK